jgi:hypothetical protein
MSDRETAPHGKKGDSNYEPTWCIESTIKALGINDATLKGVNQTFRSELHGTQDRVYEGDPEVFVRQDPLTTKLRKLYKSLGNARFDEIVRMIKNPQNPVEQFTRSGILNGVAGALKASRNQITSKK